MELLKIEPGPKVAMIMNALMKVLEDPGKNTKEYLEDRARELYQLSDLELLTLSKLGKVKTAELGEEEVGKI